jgi:predicted enzyme related to lactoylglutathione lyase
MSTLAPRLGQVAVTVADVPRALAFYRDLVGLEFLFAPGPELAFLRAGEVRLMLTTPQGAGAVGANSLLYFAVDDIVARYERLVAAGASGASAPHLVARLPDHELWIGFLKDPDGNLVGLMEEKR